MKLNNIWGYGQLFGFSAIDGINRYYNDFIGTLTHKKIGIRFEIKDAEVYWQEMYSLAKKYYLDAAILNNITACKNLALLYKEENNMEEFYRWSKKVKELEKK